MSYLRRYAVATISIVGLLVYALSVAPAAINTAVPLETGTLLLAPKDTFLNTNKKNYSTSTTLHTYTWPDYKVANAIVLKFDLSTLPAGAVVTGATLHLALLAHDSSADGSYAVSAHRVLGKNPNIGSATGYTFDGRNAWTANDCCAQSAPLAQADISPAYDTQSINKVKDFKSWTITTMVQEWQLNPGANFGVLLNSDASKPRDRYRTFASTEHTNATLRPYLKVTYTAADATPPSVSVTSPAPGDVAGLVAVSADATDNAAVAGVQFLVNGTPACAEVSAAPYVFNWDSTTRSDGTYAITAVARDTSGNVATSSPVSVVVHNGLVILAPQDTSLNINTNNYSSDQLLTTYTWPDYQPANAVLMKFDLSPVPPGAIVNDATLLLSLVQSDAVLSETYNVTANKVVGRNPVIEQATGYLADAATGWTPNTCCHDSVPLGQADISPPYATAAVDGAAGVKTWTITTMVQEWLADPSSNFGLLLNSDATKPRDRYRFFASMEHATVALRPMLQVSYSTEPDTTPPTVAITAPSAGQTVANVTAVSATASDNSGVAGVQLHLDGAPLGSELTAPYTFNWDTRSVANGQHSLTAVARDAAGNSTVSDPVGVVVQNDSTPPVISGVTVSGVTSSGATISWTTDEASDSQVEYGPTTAYGTLSTLDGSFAAAHSVTLSGLADVTQYHFRVRSRDQSGNLATSADSALTTVDGTAPAVSITSPSHGAGVSGTITVTANAGDNVGVAGVQFILDGANLGVVDGAAPYATSWNTTGAANGTHTLMAVAHDASGNSATSALVTVTVNAGVVVLSPEDTSLNINANNYSADSNLTTYTWPDNQVANAILMKFDLSSVPLNAVVEEARLFLSLTESDTLAAATYTIAASRVLTRNPVISLATGYTADGATPWTPNSCCHNGVPLAQADISPAYDTLHVDKVPGFKSWNITTMLQEWLADPSANFGVLLSSDATKGSDHYRYFASMEHTDAALRPHLQVTYVIPLPDPTPPSVSISAPAAGASLTGTVTVSAAASDNVGVVSVQFTLDGVNLGGKDTTAPFSIAWDTTTATAGSHTLAAIAKDAAGNVTTSAGVTVTVVLPPPDVTVPSVSITAPAAGATVSGTISVTGSATDNVGVTSVQFKLDGSNLGTADSSAPYSVSWNTTGATNGSHTITAVARDAAGNQTTSAAVSVTVSNAALPTAPEAICPGGSNPNANVVWCDNFQQGDYLSRWMIGSNKDQWPASDFVKSTAFGFNDSSAAWTNNLVFDDYWGYFGYDASDYFPPQSEFYIRFYQYVSNPYTWGSLEDKSVLLHDASRSLDTYIATSRVGGGESCEAVAGAKGKPVFINYQDRDWPEMGGQCTKVNRYQNQGNDITLQPGKWYLFEAYIKLNTAGSNNGIVKLWIDDASVPITTQTLRLAYTDMRFLRSGDAGKKLSELRLTVYNQRCDSGSACPSQRNQFHKWDNFVISTTPIGPMR